MKNRQIKSNTIKTIVNISMTILFVTLVVLLVSIIILGIVNIWRMIGM